MLPCCELQRADARTQQVQARVVFPEWCLGQSGMFTVTLRPGKFYFRKRRPLLRGGVIHYFPFCMLRSPQDFAQQVVVRRGAELQHRRQKLDEVVQTILHRSRQYKTAANSACAPFKTQQWSSWLATRLHWQRLG